MVIDKIENAHLYTNLSPRIAKALEVLKDKSILEKENGKYPIDGDNIFCLVQRYDTRTPDTGNLEAHKKYIDVQYVVSGEEIINHIDPKGLEVRKPYDDSIDKILFHPPARMNPVVLTGGMFGIYWPDDAHMACMQVAGPAKVHKVVVKVRI